VAQRYDAVIFSDARFAAPLSVPRFVIYPSVDPLSERNRDMSRAEQAQHLDRLHVPRDKPFLLQVGPFRRSHDPLGVINAYRLVKKHHDVRLVLAGPARGRRRSSRRYRRPATTPTFGARAAPIPTGINALERGAAIVIHKPLTVGLGIDVAAAMWKGKPVVGSLAGGIPNQVIFGVTGYTVETVEGAAFRIRHLLGNPELIGRMGAAGREHIRRNFLITRHLGDYLALLALLTK
jgi:trehalose synthase